MKCAKLLILLLGCLVSLLGVRANALWNYTTAIDSFDLVTNPCQDVRLAGFICVDCATLGFCSYSNGLWQTVEMSSCQSERGFYCSDEGTFGCTWQPRCTVPVRGKFYCQGAGIYPDPYDCRSYHECTPLNVDIRHQCTNGAAYSLLTQSCTLPRDSEYCTQKQYTCNSLGQTGAWAANSSYYYVCQKETQGTQDIYYPLMMKCNEGYIFNGHSCVLPSRFRSVQSNKMACQDGVRYPSDNPNAYFACRNGKLIYEGCPLGLYFDAAVKSCLKDTQICQEGAFYPANNQYGFNYCMHGKLIYQRCPIKYYFDSKFNACRRLEETCKDYTTSPAETSHGFYMCIKGKLSYDKCPVASSGYDENRDICVMN